MLNLIRATLTGLISLASPLRLLPSSKGQLSDVRDVRLHGGRSLLRLKEGEKDGQALFLVTRSVV